MTSALTYPLPAAPLSDHLHNAARDMKRELAGFIQSLTVKHEGQAELKMLLDSHQWTTVPGTPISMRHIERHPDDPDNAGLNRFGGDETSDCPDVLPHLSVVAIPRGARGVMISQYHSRLTLASGRLVVNGVLVTAHERTRAEYRASPGERLEFEALEMCYAHLKYFADFGQVLPSESGPSLEELLARQEGTPWVVIEAP